MKKFTYQNDYTVLGNIVDENEMTYTVEFEAAPGFKDTVTFEKEMTVVEEIETLTTVQDVIRNIEYKGILVEGKTYNYIVFQHELAPNIITVKKLAKIEGKGFTSCYYWDIKKENLKGSGGLNKKVMEVLKGMIK